MQQLIAIADDLSGAAETAAKMLPKNAHVAQETHDGGSRYAPSSPPRVVLLPANAPGGTSAALAQAVQAALESADDGRPLILDSDNRRFGDGQAADRLRIVLDTITQAEDHSPVVFLKIDSLLRGPLSGQVGVLTGHGTVILAPALPELGRSTVNGVVMVDAVPLGRTGLWHAEGRPAPASVAEALLSGSASAGRTPPLTTGLVGLSAVRRGRDALAAELQTKASQVQVVICDAETPGDLDAVVAAAREIPGVRFAGSSALGAALWRSLTGRGEAGAPAQKPGAGVGRSAVHAEAHAPGGQPRDAGFPLLVVGSASPQSREQLSILTGSGAAVFSLHPADLLDGTPDLAPIQAALQAGPVAVSVEAAVVDPARSAGIAAALARLVAPLAAGRPLMLTGGETARAVLDAVNVRQLDTLAEIEHGAVLSLTETGSPVVTRPGSFGGPDSLRSIVEELGFYSPVPTAAPKPSLPQKGPSMNIADPAELPYVAVTMGDGAGVGPEVVVAAVLDRQINSECRPVVIGDALRLRQAADILGIEADIQKIETVEDAVFTPGRVNVIDLALLPADLPWGRLSAVAGHAAYEYIRVASELAMAGTVQAICTAPLNKEALHAAGHIFPGHTELLAQLTGTEEVSMMLSTPKIKVIHVTTHIGLMDAVRKINPELVERTIRRGHEALIRAGIPNPKIGVCAINPHAGEGGLFGQGEEAEKIEPGVKAAQGAGIDVTGPLPADTLFFLAGRGDYDLVVAMYHDQGHGPVKVLGIEAGVNITVGLPVIRTSVDHGTAFDIAGRAIADSRSMVEALHQAAEMATRPTVAV